MVSECQKIVQGRWSFSWDLKSELNQISPLFMIKIKMDSECQKLFMDMFPLLQEPQILD